MNVGMREQRMSVSDLALEGKVAVVTGGGRVIGQACALALAARGASVAVSYHASADGAQATVSHVTQAGGSALAAQVDLAKPESAEAFVAEIIGAYGHIDVLVNNARIQFVSPIEEFPIEKWDAIIAINLSSAFHTIRAALPGLKEINDCPAVTAVDVEVDVVTRLRSRDDELVPIGMLHRCTASA